MTLLKIARRFLLVEMTPLKIVRRFSFVGLLSMFISLPLISSSNLDTACSTCPEVCQWETFEARCRPDEVIIVTGALYGRMQYGRCVKRDYGYVGCSVDVRNLADFRCSGKQTCQIAVPDKLFDGTLPCPEDLKLYLMASYMCIKVVVRPKTGRCHSSEWSLSSGDSSSPAGGATTTVPFQGVLSSLASSECGTPQTPWILQAKPGQRINITLVDFTSPPPSVVNASRLGGAGTGGASAEGGQVMSSSAISCQVLAVIKDTGSTTTKTMTVCGGGLGTNVDRERIVYLSESEVVEVRMMSTSASKMSAKDAGQFLLRYHAVGCPDLTPPLNGWWRREGSQSGTAKATTGCDNSVKVFSMTCERDTWSGDVIVNCTDVGMFSAVHTLASMSQGTALVSVIIIAVLVGLVMVAAGACFIKRRHSQSPACWPFSSSSSSPSFIASQRSRGILAPIEPNYFTSVNAQSCRYPPDYFTASSVGGAGGGGGGGIGPVTSYGGPLHRKDSSYSGGGGGSDGNDYAYVEDFACVTSSIQSASVDAHGLQQSKDAGPAARVYGLMTNRQLSRPLGDCGGSAAGDRCSSRNARYPVTSQGCMSGNQALSSSGGGRPYVGMIMTTSGSASGGSVSAGGGAQRPSNFSQPGVPMEHVQFCDGTAALSDGAVVRTGQYFIMDTSQYGTLQ